MMELGVQPDILCCRTEHELDLNLRRKIAKFCNVSMNAVIESRDASSIYDVPLLMQAEEFDKVVLDKLGLATKSTHDLYRWNSVWDRLKHQNKEVTIGFIGTYVDLNDSYNSFSEDFIQCVDANESHVSV